MLGGRAAGFAGQRQTVGPEGGGQPVAELAPDPTADVTLTRIVRVTTIHGRSL